MIERIFKIKAKGSSIKIECIGGATTFVTLAYIIFVQPTVLSVCGMDFGAVMVATCLSAALGTLLMGLMANYPIALAPAMGHNFYFVYSVCLGMGVAWPIALGANFLSGAFFVVSALFAFRKKIIRAIPASLRNAIAVGIGLLIAMIGLQWSGIVVAEPGTLVGLGDLRSNPVLLAIFGTLLISILMARKVRGSILFGIFATALLGIPLGIVKYQGIIAKPPPLDPTLFKLDIVGALNPHLFAVIFVLFFLDLFDTVGTLVGVGEQAGFIKDGKLPRSNRALLSDAIATTAGTCMGTSTVTSYIESNAGVVEGARTGFANLVTAALLVLSIFFYPLVKMVGSGYEVSQGVKLYPVTAPALIVVGSMMLQNVRKIQWEDVTESIPAFLTLIAMPMTMSITEGISFGFISYSVIKLFSGRIKEVHPLIYIFAILFALRYAFLKF